MDRIRDLITQWMDHVERAKSIQSLRSKWTCEFRFHDAEAVLLTRQIELLEDKLAQFVIRHETAWTDLKGEESDSRRLMMEMAKQTALQAMQEISNLASLFLYHSAEADRLERLLNLKQFSPARAEQFEHRARQACREIRALSRCLGDIWSQQPH